ncbi:hypothetical protein BBJ29_009303 [Phytophthora kernoviae]|uniref:Lipoyl-binding domain-containing protein n=1 Tax=Phytophthora kernoviae TaxID=325452 RepID=A0A421FUD4_9STRA|nr:hypothetical protein BBJ29_009303 [Phytophthora kernoviae]
MMRAVTRVLGTHGRRRSALTTPWHTERGLLQHIGAFTTNATPPEDEQVTLPSHIKFRMPDLDFKEVGSGAGETTLTKWYVKEGSEVKDGTHLCEVRFALQL